jgi:hypothetical protein
MLPSASLHIYRLRSRARANTSGGSHSPRPPMRPRQPLLGVSSLSIQAGKGPAIHAPCSTILPAHPERARHQTRRAVWTALRRVLIRYASPACPTVLIGARLQVNGNCLKHCQFPVREEMPGSLAPIKTLTPKLSVNSEFQPARECEKRAAAGVRNIEAQLPAARAISQSRLTRRIITEKKLFRFDIQVAVEDSPEHPAGNDKSLTIPLKVKAVCSPPFITREDGENLLRLSPTTGPA